MALWLASIRKAVNASGIAYKWSNRYFVNANTSGEALGIAANIWINGERLFHNQLAFAYEFYVNNTADPPNTPGVIGSVLPGVQRGSAPATAATTVQILPPGNVIRVDFPVPGSRNSRKFYRLPMLESDITEGQLSASTATLVQSGINYIASLAGIRDVDGEPFGGAGVIRGVTMRRLGREAYFAVPTGPAYG